MKKIDLLISSLSKLPGIGPKSAERIAYHILRISNDEVKELTSAILSAKNELRICKVCYNYSETEVCNICADEHRDNKTICVVKEPQDVNVIEHLNIYKGVYHVLGGTMSPKKNVSPQNLRIKELLERIKNDTVKEVILAIDPDIEGEMTINYIAQLIKNYVNDIIVSRISIGIPAGGDIEYADNITLTHAFRQKKEI